jgi:hypothetical protein
MWDKEIELRKRLQQISAAATDFPAHVRLSLDELLLSRARLRFV